MKELEPLYVAGQTIKWYNCFGKNNLTFPQKLNIKLPYNIAILLQVSIFKRNDIVCQTKTYTQIFIPTPFITAKRQKQPTCPSTDEWISKMQQSHTVDYYLAIKKNEIQIHATTYMNLENIFLSERHQSQKTTHSMILLI